MTPLNFRSLYSSRKSEPTKKSLYRSKSGISTIRLLREDLTNSTIVSDILNYVVSFLKILSLATCWLGKWSIKLMKTLYRLLEEVKSRSFIYELKDFSIRNCNSLMVVAGLLHSWRTNLYSLSFYKAIISIRQWFDLRANWIILVRFPILAYIYEIFIHTFLTFYLSDSMFSRIVRACRRKFIVFSGGSGKSANCSNIFPEVACMYPRACSQISKDLAKIFSHLEGSEEFKN